MIHPIILTIAAKVPFQEVVTQLKGELDISLTIGIIFCLMEATDILNFSRSSSEKFKEYSIPSSSELYYIQNESDSRYEDFYTLSLNYERLFNNKDHKLTSYIYYTQEWGGSNENIDQYITDENWEVIDNDPYRIFIDEPGERI